MSGMSVHGLCNLIGQPAQAQSIVDGFNYVVEQKGLKKVHFISGLYAEDEVRRDPDKGKVQGILFQGEPGKPVAVLIAGGGFDGVASYLETPAAHELHRRGYSAFVLVYRVNVELHETESAGQGRGGIRGCAAGGKVSDRASGRVRLYDGRLWYVRVLRWRPDDDSLRIF